MVAAFDNSEDPVCRNAPQLLVVYGPKEYTWGNLDAAIAIANLELAAKTSGLGTCWGGFVTNAAASDKQIGKHLGLDDSEEDFCRADDRLPEIRLQKSSTTQPAATQSCLSR